MVSGVDQQDPQNYIKHLEFELAQCRSMLDLKDKNISDLKSDYTKQRHEIRRLRDENENLLRERDNLRKNLHDAADLSNTRGKELAATQHFLSKADNLSGSEVKERVNALNEEIFQAAASLGECMVHRRYDLSDSDRRYCTDTLRDIVGDKILRILLEQAHSPERSISSLLVQVAVQIFLVDRCEHQVSDWDPGDSKLTKGLKKLYKNMRKSEQEAVCGRWKALTMAQITPDLSLDDWTKAVMKNLDVMFEVAFWHIDHRDQLDAFRKRLQPIFSLTQELRLAIGQKVTSVDYQVYLPPSDDPFMSSYMEEAYGDDAGIHHEPRIVAGTTSMGLSKRLPNSLKLESVLSPKVVVESNFRAALAVEAESSRKDRTSSQYLDGHDRRY